MQLLACFVTVKLLDRDFKKKSLSMGRGPWRSNDEL
jgi:hypothetical protein